MNTVRALVMVAVAASGTVFAPPAVAAVPAGSIVYVLLADENYGEEIATIRADGSRQRVLTNGKSFSSGPAYSPDGRRIAFTSSRSMPPGFEGEQRFYAELYVMDADGTNVQRITFSEGVIDWQAAWSPDGRRIVVARGPGTTPPPGHISAPTDLWIIDLDTGRERQLTATPGTWESYAHWSPDGKRIAFTGDPAEPGNDDVYTIGVGGGDRQRLTSNPGFEGDVHYSPDGRSLAFDSDRTGNVDIFVMRTDGTRVRQLTNHPGADFAPSYSPDGKYIAFDSDRDGTVAPAGYGYADIFRMRADGAQQTNLTKSPELMDMEADWGR